MGIRKDQFIGLNERARKLVEGEKILRYKRYERRVYPDGTEVILDPEPVYGSLVEAEEYARIEGWWPLLKYTLPGDTQLYEDVQASPWSAGPMYFVALRQDTPDGPWVPESLWTAEDARREDGEVLQEEDLAAL